MLLYALSKQYLPLVNDREQPGVITKNQIKFYCEYDKNQELIIFEDETQALTAASYFLCNFVSYEDSDSVCLYVSPIIYCFEYNDVLPSPHTVTLDSIADYIKPTLPNYLSVYEDLTFTKRTLLNITKKIFSTVRSLRLTEDLLTNLKEAIFFNASHAELERIELQPEKHIVGFFPYKKPCPPEPATIPLTYIKRKI